jgi:hypothetical protein
MKLLELDEGTQRRLNAHPEILTEYHGRLLWEVKDLAIRHRLADETIDNRWSGSQLKARIEEVTRQRDVDVEWLRRAGLPRVYEIALPGLRLRMDFQLLDANGAIDALRGATQRAQSLAQLQTGPGPTHRGGSRSTPPSGPDCEDNRP